MDDKPEIQRKAEYVQANKYHGLSYQVHAKMIKMKRLQYKPTYPTIHKFISGNYSILTIRGIDVINAAYELIQKQWKQH